MPEILTESFCERCGTRYTFQATAPRGRRGTKLKVLGRGLKNFVLHDETTLTEALADARNDVLRDVSSQQLDAFHQTFNFCMTCRQYTCSNCWNEVEGRCLTCAPHLGHEILPAPFPDLQPGAGLAPDILSELNGHPPNGNLVATTESPRQDVPAWPELDLRGLGHAEPEVEAAAEADPEVEVEAVAEPDVEVEAVAEAEVEVDAVAEAEPEVEAVAEAEPAAPTSITPPHGLHRLRPRVARPARFAPADEWAAHLGEPVEADAETPQVAEPEVVADAPAELEASAIGTESVPAAPVARMAETVAEPQVEPEIVAEAQPELVSPAATPEPQGEPLPRAASPASPDERAVAAAAQTSDLLARFRPGQSLDAALAEYEATHQLQEPELEVVPEPEPVAAVAPEPELVAAVEPEPEPVATAEPEAEPVATAEPETLPEPVAAAEPEPVALAEPQPEPQPAAPRIDRVETPVWTTVAPPTPTAAPEADPGLAAAATGRPAPESTQPQWPTAQSQPQWPTAQSQWPAPQAQPQWPAPDPSSPVPFLADTRSAAEILWAASNQEVLSRPALPATGAQPSGGVQPCVSCGLSLSANARFCRRCGTRQG